MQEVYTYVGSLCAKTTSCNSQKRPCECTHRPSVSRNLYIYIVCQIILYQYTIIQPSCTSCRCALVFKFVYNVTISCCTVCIFCCSCIHIGRSRSLSERKRHSSARLSIGGKSQSVAIQKSNSCSTIFTDDSTVSQPNLKCTLKWYMRACHTHMHAQTHIHILIAFLSEDQRASTVGSM